MKVTKRQLRQIIKEERAIVEQEMLSEFDFAAALEKGEKLYKKAEKGGKAIQDFSQTERGRKVTGKALDFVEKKAGEKGYGDEAALGRGVAGALGLGGALEVGDADMPKKKIRILARQAKYGKKGLKSPTGMPIGDVEIKDEDGEKVYVFADDKGEDLEHYRDRGDGIYELVDESLIINDAALLECRMRLIVRHTLRNA